MQEQAGFWLSPQQKFAWRVQEALGHSTRIVGRVAIEGKVEADRLRSALIEIVSRHEALRTIFQRPAGMKMPLQVVLDTAEIQWELAECRVSDSAEQEQRIEKLLHTESA